MLFSPSIRSGLATVVFAALAASAAPGLTLKVSGSDVVKGVDNLRVDTTLVNTGDETLKLLNDPLSPLSKLPAETFTITDVSGTQASFTGIRAKYVPAQAAKLEDESAFTVLAPGKTVRITHDLSTTYNFTRTGERLYKFEARKLFYRLDANKDAVPINATVETHTARISGKLAVARPSRRLERRASFIGCSPFRQARLDLAASAAQTYAAGAKSYLDTHNTSATVTTRYTTWFGFFTSPRFMTVSSHFEQIHNDVFSAYTYDCTCTDPGTFAYVNPNEPNVVTLCGAFWNAPLTGRDSQGGTLVHESSHFTHNGGTQDYAYGQRNAMLLAALPMAVMNADSHEYFAENNPFRV
ncbi:hypothetical protein ONZ45_g12642 [Pleurotus djamor]|nr:hypothetical protein ONZ45_g12642 [Pleurotus djamor]